MRLTMPSIVLALAVCASGCGTTMATRDLVHQTWGAGRQGLAIAQAMPAGPTRTAFEAFFTSISLNMEAVAEDVGAPEQPASYSGEASAAARSRQAEEIAAGGFWNRLLEIGKGAAGIATGGSSCKLIVGILSLLGIGGIAAAGVVKGRKPNGVETRV